MWFPVFHSFFQTQVSHMFALPWQAFTSRTSTKENIVRWKVREGQNSTSKMSKIIFLCALDYWWLRSQLVILLVSAKPSSRWYGMQVLIFYLRRSSSVDSQSEHYHWNWYLQVYCRLYRLPAQHDCHTLPWCLGMWPFDSWEKTYHGGDPPWIPLITSCKSNFNPTLPSAG